MADKGGNATMAPVHPDVLGGQPPGRLPLSLRLRLWRNRQIASPAFRRLVGRLPLLRGVSNRKARDLFGLTGGFIYSQVLLAGVRLGLYEALAARTLSTEQLAGRFGLAPDRLAVLLGAQRDLGLLIEWKKGHWVLDDSGVVVAADRGLSEMILHHAMLYRDLEDPLALLRAPRTDTELSRYWAYARGGDPGGLSAEAVAPYSALMRESQAMMADCILATHDFSTNRALLDVGGGDGAFLAAAGAVHPTLKLHLFDLPAVAERARDHLARSGLASRSTIHPGDFIRDPLPADVDCITLIRILCDHDDDRVAAILANLYRSTAPGTAIVVAEAMNGPDPGARLSSAYFSMYFLAMGSGRCRSAAEISGMLSVAGFSGARTIKSANPLLATLVVARR